MTGRSENELVEDTKDMVGTVYSTTDHYDVGREKVRELARALHDANPMHWNEKLARERGHDNLLAPLTFVAVVGGRAQQQFLEEKLPVRDLAGVLQVDQKLHFHQPVMVGDQLYCDVSLDSFKQIAGTDLFNLKTVLRDKDKGVMVSSWTTLAARTGEKMSGAMRDLIDHVMMVDVTDHLRSGLELQAEPVTPPTNDTIFPAINFDDLTVGQEIEPRLQSYGRMDLANYVGVSADPNPIHLSDHLAQTAGLDTVVAQAMLTMGVGCGYITSFVGDPAAVLEMNVRFTSPVYVYPTTRANVTYAGKVKSLDPETRRGTIMLTVTQDGRKVFGRATADVQFS